MKPFVTGQEIIDAALSIEKSVKSEDWDLYLECMNGVPMSERVKNPRPLDRDGRDVRDGCILSQMFNGIIKRRIK
jgi:hypothetical protein